MVISICFCTVAGSFLNPAHAQDQSVSDNDIEATGTMEPVVGDGGPSQPVISGDLGLRDDYAEEETPDTTGMGPSGWDYLKVLIGLIVVIVIVYTLSMIMKRFITVRGLASSSESLKVLYTLSLSPARTLYLVRLSDRILLIGAGEGGIRTLTEITDPAEVSQILKELEFKGNFDLNPFREKFRTLTGEDYDRDGDQDGVENDLGVRQKKIQGTMDRLKNRGDDK